MAVHKTRTKRKNGSATQIAPNGGRRKVRRGKRRTAAKARNPRKVRRKARGASAHRKPTRARKVRNGSPRRALHRKAHRGHKRRNPEGGQPSLMEMVLFAAGGAAVSIGVSAGIAGLDSVKKLTQNAAGVENVRKADGSKDGEMTQTLVVYGLPAAGFGLLRWYAGKKNMRKVKMFANSGLITSTALLVNATVGPKISSAVTKALHPAGGSYAQLPARTAGLMLSANGQAALGGLVLTPQGVRATGGIHTRIPTATSGMRL